MPFSTRQHHACALHPRMRYQCLGGKCKRRQCCWTGHEYVTAMHKRSTQNFSNNHISVRRSTAMCAYNYRVYVYAMCMRPCIVHRADTFRQWNARTSTHTHTWRKKFAPNIYLEFRISFLITQRHFRFWLLPLSTFTTLCTALLHISTSFILLLVFFFAANRCNVLICLLPVT